MTTITKDQALKIAREAGDYADKHHEHHGGWIEAESYYFANNVFKLGRNAGLEAAQQICREINCIQNFEGAVASIESLKDNTP
jgi:hypothetical protein